MNFQDSIMVNFNSNDNLPDEVEFASTWVSVSIVRGSFSIQEIENFLYVKFRRFARWKWNIKKFNQFKFIMQFPRRDLDGDNVSSILVPRRMINLRRWSLKEGSKHVMRKERIWVILRYLSLVFRNARVMRNILRGVGSLIRLQENYMQKFVLHLSSS